MARYAPSPLYLAAAAVSCGLTVFSAWFALRWGPAFVATFLFALTSGLMLFLALKPAICVFADRMTVGSRAIKWTAVRRVDQTGWIAPLVLDLTLSGGERIRLLYPGNAESANELLGIIQQRSTQALINGIEWRHIFGEPAAAEDKPVQTATAPAPRVKLLTDEDEAEVERLYQQLKSAGRFLDQDK